MTKDQLERAIKSNRPELVALAAKYLDLTTRPYYTFQPRPDNPQELDQQTGFVRDKFPGMACVIGGNASGKSFSGGWKVADFLFKTPPPRPSTPFWVLSQTTEMAAGNNWGKNLAHFIGPDDIADISWHNQARKLPKAVVLKNHKNGNNWVLEFQSYDMDRRRLQAYSLGGFWCDELCPWSILMELWVRCRDYDFPGSKIYTLTPIVDGSKGYSTVELEEVYKNQDKYPDWRFYRLNSRCNDKLAPGFIDRFISSEVEDLRETRLTGAFCSLSGAVYKSFGDNHICKPFAIPDDWHKIRGIDFGWSHETVCLWMARDPTGHYYVYHEYARQQALMADHARAINGIPWDKSYGPTWADSAAAQERAELHKLGITTWGATKDVLPGIASVQRLLREDRLKIFPACTTLIRQMRTYCWSRTQKDKVEKQDDDACFVAGTFVETDRGPRRIENIQVGDMVLTRKGYRPVLASGPTGVRPVIRLICEDGRSLIGTGNHPIWDDKSGWKECRNLTPKSILLVWKPYQSASSSTASSSADTPTPNNNPIDGITRPMQGIGGVESGHYTRRFGEQHMAPFRQDATFTTETAIPSTTHWRTWSVSPQENTPAPTPNEGTARLQQHSNTLLPSALLHSNGISLRKGEHGIGNMGGKDGRTENLLLSCAKRVESSTRDMEAASAPTTASQPLAAAVGLTTRIASVSVVESSGDATSTATLQLVPVRVAQHLPGELAKVYNLTVADAHEYFANGILVHNCDALRYGLHSDFIRYKPAVPEEKISLTPEEAFRKREREFMLSGLD